MSPEHESAEVVAEAVAHREGEYRKLADFFGRPVIIRRINGWFTLVWLCLVVPTLLWWSKSILWVALLSIWANVVSHYTTWLAARVEVREEHVEVEMTDARMNPQGHPVLEENVREEPRE